jgi:transcriptional regulator with XRE-family HTH domain
MAQSIGANIKAKRRALGLNQEDLARKLGLTQANISRIEASVKGPSGDMLLAISEVLGCDVRELLGMENLGPSANDLDEDTRFFVSNAIKSDPQFGVHLRNFVSESGCETDEDWKFLTGHLKLTLAYVAGAIRDKARAR